MSYSPDGRPLVMRGEDEDGTTYRLSKMSGKGGATRDLLSGAVRPRFIDWGRKRRPRERR